MTQKDAPIYLIPRKTLLPLIVVMVIVLLAIFGVLLSVYPMLDTNVRGHIEIISGVVVTALLYFLLWSSIVMRKSRRLQQELRTLHAKPDEDVSQKTKEIGNSTLMTVIRDYSADLYRSGAVKSGRIAVQQALIRTLLRSAKDQKILVLSGTGELLYRSAGWDVDSEGRSEGWKPRLEPPGPGLAAHLLAGKGSGDVMVDGVNMHFAGIFGKIVAAQKSDISQEHVLQRALAYIVISAKAITPVSTTVRDEMKQFRPVSWGERVRSLFPKKTRN